MQSVSTRRLSPTPNTAVIAVAIGLAVLTGIVALEVTDTMPGRGDSASQAVSAPAIISENAGEGLVNPRDLNADLGAGATLDSVNPTIVGVPSIGQGEGLVGPGGLSNSATVAPAMTSEQMLFLEQNGVFDTDTSVAPALTSDRMRFLEQNGVFAVETAPTTDQYIAGPHNEGYTDESSPAATDYVDDLYLGGPTEH